MEDEQKDICEGCKKPIERGQVKVVAKTEDWRRVWHRACYRAIEAKAAAAARDAKAEAKPAA